MFFPALAPSYKEIILNSFDQYSLLKAYVRRIMDNYGMNNRNKLIELLIYIAIVVVGVVLLLTGEPERAVENMDMGGTSYAAVLDE